jgi:hypothetical protein
MQAVPGTGQPAAAAAPQPPVPMALLATSPDTYRTMYIDPRYDHFHNNYVNLYNEYAIGQNAPATLRNSVYPTGNGGTYLHALVHVREVGADPNDPGRIIGLHRLTRHEPRFGQTALPYDNMGLAFYGDTQHGQVPTTLTVPDAWFNQIGPVQAPTLGLLGQELAAQPLAELFGPYAAGDPDIEPVSTRTLILVPNCYVVPFLSTSMTPREAYNVLSGMIQQDGHNVACEPLLDWLRVTLVRRAGATITPATQVDMPTPPAFRDPQVHQKFNEYRVQVLQRDFPHMLTGAQHQSAALIAQGISTLTNEQRLTRVEAQQRQAAHDAPKTPADLFGTRIDRVLRWCQVNSENDLPPIYAELAKTKKGKVRVVLQNAVEEALENLKYVEDFPLSTTLATKIQDLKWASALPDNLSLGVHIFSLGNLDAEAMEVQRQLNQHADAMYAGDAAPALPDIVTLQDSKQDLCLPRSFAQLRYLVERSEALWLTLLGSQHPVTVQHRAFRDTLVAREQRLELITTRDPTYCHMVPALLGRFIQIEVNHWLNTQSRTAQPVRFDTLLDIFQDIDRQRQWEPSFPSAYLSQPKPVPLSISTGSVTGITVGSGITTNTAISQGTSATNPTTTTSTAVVRNPAYNDRLFGPFKAQNIRARAVKDYVRKNKVAYPVNSRKENMCITYHTVGLCNEACRQVADHTTHSADEDETLRLWCTEHWKSE